MNVLHMPSGIKHIMGTVGARQVVTVSWIFTLAQIKVGLLGNIKNKLVRYSIQTLMASLHWLLRLLTFAEECVLKLLA